MEKMTLHRALSELKLSDAKIEKQISEIVTVGIYQKGKQINGVHPEADFTKAAESTYQSIESLIDRKSKIKSALVNANAVTNVIVGNKTMTIADAINNKAAIKFKKSLLNKLKQQLAHATGTLNKSNETVAQNLQQLLTVTLGKDNVKAGATDVEAISTPFMAANTVLLFDPLKIQDKINKLDEEISTFEMEVDAVLSEINATTFIEF